MEAALEHLIVVLPLIGLALLLFQIPRPHIVSFVFSLLSVLCSVFLLIRFPTGEAQVQWLHEVPWIEPLNLSYSVGIDGISVMMLVPLIVVFPMLVLFNWSQTIGLRGKHAIILLFQTAAFGAVLSRDFLQTLFFLGSFSLLTYFLLSIWGSGERDRPALFAIVIETLGNALWLLALFVIYYAYEPHTFSYETIIQGQIIEKTILIYGRELSSLNLAFSLFLAGFVLRVPVFPLQGWYRLQAKYGSATTVALISGVSIPLCCYFFLRVLLFVFHGNFTDYIPSLLLVSTVNLVAGTLVLLTYREQQDLFSGSTLTFIGAFLLGIISQEVPGLMGANFSLMIFSLGITALALFLGQSERMGFKLSRGVSYRWFSESPFLAVVLAWVVITLSALPFTGGYVALSLVVSGVGIKFSAQAVVMMCSAILTTLAYFRFYRQTFLGREEFSPKSVVSFREKCVFIPLVLTLLFVGVFPKPWTDLMKTSVISLLSLQK